MAQVGTCLGLEHDFWWIVNSFTRKCVLFEWKPGGSIKAGVTFADFKEIAKTRGGNESLGFTASSICFWPVKTWQSLGGHVSHGQNTRRPLYQGGVRFCITHAKTMENDKVSPKNDNP